MADFVWIHNPTTGGVALQPADAVAEIWVKKGFVLVNPDFAEASDALGFPVTSPRQLPEDYVRAVATRPAPSVDSRPAEPAEPASKATATRRSTPAKEA